MKKGRNGSSERTTWIACLGLRSTNQPVSTSRSRRAQFLSGRLDEFHIQAGILAEDAPAEFDGRETLIEIAARRLAHPFRRVPKQRASVGADTVPPFAAAQNVDRLAEELAHDVPERDVDGGDRLDGDTPPPVINTAAIHAIPKTLDLQRILADDQRGQSIEAFHSGLGAPARSFDRGPG